MATVGMPLPVLAGYPPDGTAGSAAAYLQMVVTSDASDPQVLWPELLFDKDTNEHWYWSFVWPSNYVGSPVLRVFWTSSITTNQCVWGCQIMAITPGDAASMKAREFDPSINSTEDDAPGTAYYPLYCDVTLTNDDSVAAGDEVVLCLFRHADDAADDMAGDAIVKNCELRYSDA